MNRVIKKYDLDMIYVSGPGHGGPAVVSNTYIEGPYSEFYPNISRMRPGSGSSSQFSFPAGIPSHASPECPGSIHEGGELGYSLSHSSFVEVPITSASAIFAAWWALTQHSPAVQTLITGQGESRMMA